MRKKEKETVEGFLAALVEVKAARNALAKAEKMLAEAEASAIQILPEEGALQYKDYEMSRAVRVSASLPETEKAVFFHWLDKMGEGQKAPRNIHPSTLAALARKDREEVEKAGAIVKEVEYIKVKDLSNISVN